MATRLMLVCHASTSAVRQAAFPADEPLDGQAHKTLAEFPPLSLRPDRAMSSPALRARQTAEALGLDPAVDPVLRDCEYGRWSGLGLDAVQAQSPEALAAWLCDPAATPPGGESVVMLIARVAGWLDGLIGQAGRIVAVTHASVIRAAILHAIEATPQSYRRIDIAPLSMTRLSGHDGHWTLASIGGVHAC